MTNENTADRPTGRRAQVQTVALSEDAVFQAEHENAPMLHHSNSIDGESAGVTENGNVWHRRPGTVTMYKKTPQGWAPRQVAATAIGANLANGFKPTCPDCKGHHGGGANDCPARPRVGYRICPICGKHVYDNQSFEPIDLPVDDPNLIRDAAYENSTPAQRTKAQLDLHLWTRHPQEARALNLAPIQELSILEPINGKPAPR